MSLVENDKRLLLKAKQVLMRKHGEENRVVVRSVWRLVEWVAARFVGISVSTSSAIPKWGLSEISELDYFSEDVHQIWRGRSE